MLVVSNEQYPHLISSETFTKTGMILVGGEISSTAAVDLPSIIRRVVRNIGYDDPKKGLDYKTCNILTAIEQQSPDIADGVHKGRKAEEIGAGDQVRVSLLQIFAHHVTYSFVQVCEWKRP